MTFILSRLKMTIHIASTLMTYTFFTSLDGGAQWLSGRVLDSRSRGCGTALSLGKTHYPLLNTCSDYLTGT